MVRYLVSCGRNAYPLTDFRKNTLQDVITKLEPELLLTVQDFHLLVRLKVFKT